MPRRSQIVAHEKAPAVARIPILDYSFTICFWAGTKKLEEIMAWTAPVAVEVCVGMEVTSYESAEI